MIFWQKYCKKQNLSLPLQSLLEQSEVGPIAQLVRASDS